MNNSVLQKSKWPKQFPPLTSEQEGISNDFMQYWHEILPHRFSVVDKFNHQYAVKQASDNFVRTLEVGAGIGEHLKYERLTPNQEAAYVALDLRENMVAQIKKNFPKITAITGDCQQPLPFPDGYFDRVLAIHVLEHLPNLPLAIRELYRLCDKTKGSLSIVIPCEGSLAYSLARKISAQRIFEKRYNQPYRWFIEREHINLPGEIFDEVSLFFDPTHTTYFPIPLPFEFCNLCIGAKFIPKAK